MDGKEIIVKSLEVGYDEHIIVRGMDLRLKPGGVTTLIGPNGCGKSTLLKAMTRILKCRGGAILLEGKEIRKMPTKELAQKISILSQHQITPDDITVQDLVSYGRMPYQKWYQGESQEDVEIVRWAMEAASVAHMADRKVRSLSGGERQRAWIATALAQKPRFLFLDEPTTYLDIAHQMEIMQLIQTLKAQLDISIIMVLHDIGQAMEVSDQVVVMKDGRKVASGDPQTVITEALIEQVYAVKCRLVPLPGRRCPTIIYESLTGREASAGPGGNCAG